MSFLLDSNIVIKIIDSDPSIVALIDQLAESASYISVITAMEVRHGVLRQEPSKLARFEMFLRQTPALDVSLAIATQCSDLRYYLTNQGKSIRTRSLDLLIASTALHHGLVLATANVRDFRDIPGLTLLR